MDMWVKLNAGRFYGPDQESLCWPKFHIGYDFAGRQLSDTTKKSFSVGPIHSTQLYHAGGISRMVPNGHAPDDAWLHLTMTTNDGKYTNEQFFHPIPLKNCQLRPTKVRSRPIGHNQVSIEVASGGVAAWVNGMCPSYFPSIPARLQSNKLSCAGFNLFPVPIPNSWTPTR